MKETQAKCDDLLNRVRCLEHGKGLTRQVSDIKTDIFGLNIVTHFNIQKGRVYEYDQNCE